MIILNVLLFIYKFSVVLAIALFAMGVIKSVHMYYERCPGGRPRKKHWTVHTVSLIKGLVVVLCPIVNTYTAWIILTHFDELCETVVDELIAESDEL